MIDNTRGKRVAILRRIELENKLHEWKETQLFFTTKTISDTYFYFDFCSKINMATQKHTASPKFHIPHSTTVDTGYGLAHFLFSTYLKTMILNK